MASYSKDVINPTFRHESKHSELAGKRISRRIKGLMKREDSLVHKKDAVRLSKALKDYGHLNEVYVYTDDSTVSNNWFECDGPILSYKKVE